MYASKTNKSGFEKVIDYSAKRLDQSKFMKDPDLLAGMVDSKNNSKGSEGSTQYSNENEKGTENEE
jgi:hypothetical protein